MCKYHRQKPFGIHNCCHRPVRFQKEFRRGLAVKLWKLFDSIKAVATNISNGGEESALYFATGDSAGGLANIVMNQGRLGIGIAVPTHHLHVRSQTNAHAGIHLEAQTSGYDAGITFIEATIGLYRAKVLSTPSPNEIFLTVKDEFNPEFFLAMQMPSKA